MADLEARQITKQFDTASQPLLILRGVTLDLSAGENLAILGPSGSGKSTLLHILGGLDAPTSGSVRLRGIDPYGLVGNEQAEFRNRNIGFIFQEHFLLPQLTALENVLVPVLARSRIGREESERGAELLAAVGLSSRSDHRPAQLSGGERQRVAVARALMLKPALVLADEPTGSLDTASAQVVGEILLKLVDREKAILVCVTHSDVLAGSFQRRAALLDGVLVDRSSSQPAREAIRAN